MAKGQTVVKYMEKPPKRTSIGGGRLKTSSMNKHKRRQKGLSNQ